MLAIASEPLLNIADTAMIGRLGVEPLAARAIGSALIGGIYWAFTFLIFGTTTLVGFHHGAGHKRACGETWVHAVFLAFVGGLGVSLFGIVFAPMLYGLMGAEEAVAHLGVPYFRVRIASAPLTFMLYATVGFLRGIQDTRTPMLIAFLVNGVNLVLDYALIYGNLALPRLDLQGAAIAAWVAHGLGAIACLAVFLFSSRIAPYRPGRWRIDVRQLLPLFRIGRDLAARTGALRFSLVFATATTARMGSVILSAHEIAFHLLMLCSDVIDGLAVAGQALMAKYLGAAQKNRAYSMGKTLIACGVVAGGLFAILFIAAKEPIIRLFTNSPEVIRVLSGRVFLLLALFQPCNGMVFVLDGLLIGAHDTRFVMWAMLIGALGLFVPISWMSLHWGWGLTGVWIGVTILMSWRLTTNLYRFTSMRWYELRSI
jgi:putative MATE family efflux protein